MSPWWWYIVGSCSDGVCQGGFWWVRAFLRCKKRVWSDWASLDPPQFPLTWLELNGPQLVHSVWCSPRLVYYTLISSGFHKVHWGSGSLFLETTSGKCFFLLSHIWWEISMTPSNHIMIYILFINSGVQYFDSEVGKRCKKKNCFPCHIQCIVCL